MSLLSLSSSPSQIILHALGASLDIKVTFAICQIVKDDLLQLALTRGDVEETTISRMICSRMLGAIAPVLESQEIEKFFLSKAMALCQVIM